MLEKLKIIGLKENTESSIAVPISVYIAMFNPEKFSVTKQIEYPHDSRHGGTGSEQRFNRIPPRSFSFELMIDGTGASGQVRVVDAEINQFMLTVGYLGDTHRPTYLIINWGTFVIRCVLKSLTTNYTLFNPAGIPLRATLNASFEEYVPPTLEELQNFRSSPDVTHIREVKSDPLDFMSYTIYKDSKYYMELARVNNLNQFRKLTPGDKIVFPPFETTAEQNN